MYAQGSPGNLGGLRISILEFAVIGNRLTEARGRRRVTGVCWSEHQVIGWYRRAKETKWRGKNSEESERLIVPLIAGNPDRGDPW